MLLYDVLKSHFKVTHTKLMCLNALVGFSIKKKKKDSPTVPAVIWRDLTFPNRVYSRRTVLEAHPLKALNPGPAHKNTVQAES